MGKEGLHLYVDGELKWKAKKLRIPISNIVNNVLKSMITQSTNGNINMLDVKNELEEIHNKIVELKLKEQELLTQEISFEEKKKQHQQKDFKELLKKADMIKRSGVMER